MIEQTDLFEFSTPRFKLDKNKVTRTIELFGGVGCQNFAMELIGVPYEAYKLVEFDEKACAAYNSMHHTSFVPTDITKIKASDLEIVERDKYNYIAFYSFPCQDISLSGNCNGFSKGSGTRSGLLWEVERLINEGMDVDVLVMENVPQVHSKSNLKDFLQWVSFLESKGYKSFFEDCNAKNIGYPRPIPQNRNRTFMISFKGDYYFKFPKKQKLNEVLLDYLEEDVNEKYFLSDTTIEYLVHHTEEQKAKGNGFAFDPIDIERERERE